LGTSFPDRGVGKDFIQLHRSQPLTYFATSTTPWPPEVVGDRFCCFLLARVASDWGVMVGLHNVMLKLAIKGYIYNSSVEY